MELLSRLRSWWGGVAGGADLNREMEAEFAHHLEERTEHLVRSGLSPAEARRRARVEFGSAASAQEHGRESRGLRLADELRGDVRYGARGLRRNPGFAAVAVLTLALGIGATTAIFTALDAVLLRGLPFAEPERLVQVNGLDVPMRLGNFEPPKTRPDIGDTQQVSAFMHVAAYARGALNLSGSGAARRVDVALVTPDFFATLGVPPARGRGFAAEEGVPGGGRVAVVSHGYWVRQLGRATNLEPHAVVLNGRRHAVIGVMPRGFAFPEEAEVWIPLTVPTTMETREAFRQFMPTRMIARLAPGVTIERAQAEVTALHVPYARPDRPREVVPAEQVKPLHATLVDDRHRVLLVLLGATGLVLLIACANVANLLLSRSSARRRELAVRAALGATPGRVLRQFMVESLLLAAVGGAVGVAFAFGGVQILDTLVPRALLGAAPLRIDIRVLAFAATLTLLTGLAFGLLPALGARRTHAGDALKAGGAGAAGTQAPRVRQGLVLAEVALAVMLLVGSALMLRSMHALLSTESGVQPGRVATLELSLAAQDYPNSAVRRQFFEDVLARLGARPEVESAAAINELPLRGVGGISFTVHPEGKPPESMDDMIMAQDLRITENYFDVMGIRILAGRAPRSRPSPEALQEVAINQALAELFWPGENPVGQYMAAGFESRLEIVGVVANVLPTSLEAEPTPQAYYPMLDEPYSNAALVARGRVPAGTLARSMESTVREVAPRQAVYNVRTMEQVIAGTLTTRRTNTWLITAFGVLALVLASIGVYGVIAFSVAQRTREIGIRIALGAGASQVRRHVLREAGALALAGIAIGTLGAWLLSSVLSGMIYGVTVRDPLAFAIAPLLILGAAAAAALIPAQRATRVDPMRAIRVE
jgi:putative ABC transport system permease protein